MEQNEKIRLSQIKQYEKIGQKFFDQIENYYKIEPLLNEKDILERKETTLRLNYARRQYILELTYNEKLNYGEIKVYESTKETKFCDLPQFIEKGSVQILYDKPGNIYFNILVAYPHPEKSAEMIISIMSS